MTEPSGLAGCTILVTRPSEEAGATSDALAVAGATVLECPAIEFASMVEENLSPIRIVLAALGERSGWLVLPSPTAVRHFGEILSRLHLGPADLSSIRFTAIGLSSADALNELGIVPTFLPPKPTAESLAETLPATIESPVLVLGSSQSRPELREGLLRRGVMVQTLPLYAPQPCMHGLAALAAALTRHEQCVTDPWMLLVTSPSAVDAICNALRDEWDLLVEVGWVAIGPTTHRRVLERGVLPRLAARADEPRPESVVAAAAQLAAVLRTEVSP